jgi:hypothetical protein
LAWTKRLLKVLRNAADRCGAPETEPGPPGAAVLPTAPSLPAAGAASASGAKAVTPAIAAAPPSTTRRPTPVLVVLGGVVGGGISVTLSS